MKEIIIKLKKNKKANVLDIIHVLPESHIEFFAFFPMFFMMIKPLYELIFASSVLPVRYILYYSFGIIINNMNAAAVVFGIFFLILRIAKDYTNGLKPFPGRFFKNNIPMIFFCFMVIMMIVSTCINGFTDAAVFGDGYRKESLFTYIIYFLIFFFVSSGIKQTKYKSILLYTFIICSIPIAVCVYINFDFVPLTALWWKQQFTGVFDQFNHYGYYMTMVILVSAALFVKEKNTALRMISLLSMSINMSVLIMNNTFGCYLAVFAGLIFNCIVVSITSRKFIKLSLLPIAIFVIYTFILSFRFPTIFSNFIVLVSDVGSIVSSKEGSGNAGTGRWTLWTITVECIKEKPLFGFGVEGIAERLWEESNRINDRSHNEFLQYAAFFGIPASISYICGAFSVFWNGLKNKYNLDIYTIAALAASFGYLFSSVFGNTMHYTAPFFFILLGLGFSVNKKKED